MIIRFVTDRFEFVHGKKPSGLGRWFFKLGTDETPWQAPGVYTLSEARNLARTEVRRRARLFEEQFGKILSTVRIEILP